MARSCENCGKTSVMVTVIRKLRGKYNPTTRKRKYPNLQWTLIGGKRIKACTQCMRTAAKAVK